MLIRLFIATLALLLCAIVARADKPTVIKDSEAIQYVGKEAEVRGRVVSVTTAHWGPRLSISEANTPIKRSLATLRPGPT